MRPLVLTVLLITFGCDRAAQTPSAPGRPTSTESATTDSQQTLVEAKQGFRTKIVNPGEPFGPAETPPGNVFELIQYKSPVGGLAAYVSRDPGDGKQHPAVIWITGGDNNSIGDVWSPNDRSNDQSVSAFKDAGIIMMFPSQRGGNDNPGQREGFLGEVDDILAAADHLVALPYVDPDRIYLGGHSTGGTMVLMVAASSDRFRAIFSLGPVATAAQYGGDCVYCDPDDEQEMALRSPQLWLHCVRSPLFVVEGARMGNWRAVKQMADRNTNPQIRFFKVPGHDHFSVIAPIAELLARQIVQGQVNITQEMIATLE